MERSCSSGQQEKPQQERDLHNLERLRCDHNGGRLHGRRLNDNGRRLHGRRLNDNGRRLHRRRQNGEGFQREHLRLDDHGQRLNGLRLDYNLLRKKRHALKRELVLIYTTTWKSPYQGSSGSSDLFFYILSGYESQKPEEYGH